MLSRTPEDISEILLTGNHISSSLGLDSDIIDDSLNGVVILSKISVVLLNDSSGGSLAVLVLTLPRFGCLPCS